MSYHRSTLTLAVLAVSCAQQEPTAELVAELDAPGWMGNAAYVISRATCDGAPCSADRRALDGGYRFDDWAWSRATITMGSFDVWKSGVTDRDDPERWRKLDVQLHARVAGTGPMTTSYVRFGGRVGNDARYTFSLRELDPFLDPARGVRRSIEHAQDCPQVPFRIGEDGRSLEIDVELYVSVNGAELRPAPGVSYRGTYATAMVQPGVCTPPATVVDKSGADVAVLQAWLGDAITPEDQPPSLGGLRFDPALCSGTDCTAAAEALLGAPFVLPFVYLGPTSGRCEVIELRTVTRRPALDAPSFAGIGFFFAGATGFVPRERLSLAGAVTLADGTPAAVHRFLAPGMCFGQGGNSSSIISRRFTFKPYARFDATSAATQYRVWDDVREDYLLGRTRDDHYGFVSRFDRSAELLRP